MYGELEDWSTDGYNQWEHDGSIDFEVDPFSEEDWSFEEEIPY